VKLYAVVGAKKHSFVAKKGVPAPLWSLDSASKKADTSPESNELRESALESAWKLAIGFA